MADAADVRRLQLMEDLAESREPLDLDELADELHCDTRTVRRDLDYLQRLLQQVHGLEVRRGKVLVTRSGYSPGYFTDQLTRHSDEKRAIARTIVDSLSDDQAIA